MKCSGKIYQICRRIRHNNKKNKNHVSAIFVAKLIYKIIDHCLVKELKILVGGIKIFTRETFR